VSTYEESLGRSSGPDFSFQVFYYFTDGSPRTDLYVAVSNTSLQFIKDGESYTATYDVAVSVLSDGGNRFVLEKVWTETVTESDYDATQSRVYHVSPRSISLEPGVYTITVEITDEISKLTMKQTRGIQVPDFRASPLSLSSLMIGSHYFLKDDRQTLLPNVDPWMSHVGEPQYVYYEVNDTLPGRRVTLNYKLYMTGRYELKPFSSSLNPPEPARQIPDTLFWSHESTFTTRELTTPIHRLLPSLPTGHCRLEVGIRETEEPISSEREIRMSRTFALWPYGFPEIVTLDQQIEVLEHIATLDEFKELKGATTKEEKQRRLSQFWAKHRNRDEYYRRAEYANRYFSCVSEGWRTPFGWAYMVVGTPETIQLLPGGSESWQYTISSSRTLQFTFLVREVTIDDTKCKTASMVIDPLVRSDLVSQWRKSE